MIVDGTIEGALDGADGTVEGVADGVAEDGIQGFNVGQDPRQFGEGT